MLRSLLMGGVDVSGLAPAAPYLPGGGQIKVVCDTDEIERHRERIQTALQAASRRAAQAGVECRLLNRDGSRAVLLGLEAQRHDLLILGRRKNPATDNDPPASDGHEVDHADVDQGFPPTGDVAGGRTSREAGPYLS